MESEQSFDLYDQEFFFHSYSMFMREKKQLIESKEGFTYVTTLAEQNVSARLLNFVPARDAAKWHVIMNSCLKKIKLDQMDEFQTEFIDVDLLLNLYMQQYTLTRR